MLRASINDFVGSWNNHLLLVGFSYHASIRMLPKKMWYGGRCRTLVGVPLDRKQLGSLQVVEATTKKLDKIKAFMKAAHNRQKAYADKRRNRLNLRLERVLLKVSPWKNIISFHKRGKKNLVQAPLDYLKY